MRIYVHMSVYLAHHVEHTYVYVLTIWLIFVCVSVCVCVYSVNNPPTIPVGVMMSMLWLPKHCHTP